MTDSSQQQEGREYSLLEAIKSCVDASMAEMRVCLPATVIEYDHTTQKCSAQPDFKRNYGGSIVEMPIIYNIPVQWPRAGAAFVHLPLKKGHKVTLSFSDRSLEKWLSNGQKNDPEDPRNHHLSDALAYPGGYPFSDAANVTNGDDIIIKHGETTEWRIKENGHFQIFNSQHEFMKKLSDIMQDLSEAVIYTCNGPQRLFHFSLRRDMQMLKTFLEK